MVRRGSRTSTAGNNPASSSDSSQWNSKRSHSTNMAETEAIGTNSSDSSKSSPPGSRLSISPPIVKKNGASGGKQARSSSNWRSRGNVTNIRHVAGDPKFSITSEDFPALPGARGSGGGNSTSGKASKRDKESGKQHNHAIGDMGTTDDSGVSMGSRGNTPTQESGRAVNARIGRGDYENKKKSLSTQVAAVISSENPKRKIGSPAKERPPRGGVKHARVPVQQPVASSSPKKKTINANAATTAPSFMKLSKVGQKIPERRGGTKINNQTASSTNLPLDKDKENKLRKEGAMSQNDSEKEKHHFEQEDETKNDVSTMIPPSHCIFHPADVPRIILGEDGEMSNIPPAMLTDQFGMAAMLPILNIVKNRGSALDGSLLTDAKKKEKSLNENIEMLSIGFDLSELAVPIKTTDVGTKTVWETFAGPFGHQPLLPTNMGLSPNQVPSVYYTARTLQSSFDMFQNIPEKFGVHELFYIFYNLPKEIWQLNASRELQYRGWRFNKVERLWVHKKLGEPDEYGITITAPQNPFTQPGTNQDEVMIGIFEIYDPEKARICSREMGLRRSDFEVPAWEQTTPDVYQKMVTTIFPKELLWGPREDRNKSNVMPGIAGIVSSGPGRNKLSNLVIPKPPKQPSERRLLSFADSPDITNFENSFDIGPMANNSVDLRRGPMFNEVIQKLQMQQHLQHQQSQMLAAIQQATRQQPKLNPSSSLSNYVNYKDSFPANSHQ